MKVTLVSLSPTQAANAAGRPALSPELLAATGARYSRSDEGLDAILSRIDPAQPEKSIDGIFRMVDYGHQSIADMAPVAIFMDGLSLWLAYHVWTLCPTAGRSGILHALHQNVRRGSCDPADLGVRPELHAHWRELMALSFQAYHESLAIWEGLVAARPELARIPAALLDDPSDKARKAVARMGRNYGFDRARYFLPSAALTNVMLIMPARGWVALCQQLLSHPAPEAVRLGGLIREELALCTPRLLRHAVRRESIAEGLRRELAVSSEAARLQEPPSLDEESTVKRALTGSWERPPTPALEVLLPPGLGEYVEAAFVADLKQHDNRYAWIGETLRRTAVRFGWEAVALAEIRDLNRHRTGTKYCPPVPLGFYGALDQIPAAMSDEQRKRLLFLNELGGRVTHLAREHLAQGQIDHPYWTLLGTQFRFEHTTTADKFIYEGELRTGTGAHYRYAQHLRDVLALWYERFPRTRGLILEGSAEPE